jgi:acyl-coenzyme A thioesterase PaaI-like protein
LAKSFFESAILEWSLHQASVLNNDRTKVRVEHMKTVPEGWLTKHVNAFDTLVGPFYFPPSRSGMECGFLADERHANLRGVVHGGVLATAFDVALGTAGRTVSAPHHHATIELGVHFISAMVLGEFAIVRSEMIRATRDFVFLRGVMTVDKRVIATGEGIWKTLRPRVTP